MLQSHCSNVRHFISKTWRICILVISYVSTCIDCCSHVFPRATRCKGREKSSVCHQKSAISIVLLQQLPTCHNFSGRGMRVQRDVTYSVGVGMLPALTVDSFALFTCELGALQGKSCPSHMVIWASMAAFTSNCGQDELRLWMCMSTLRHFGNSRSVSTSWSGSVRPASSFCYIQCFYCPRPTRVPQCHESEQGQPICGMTNQNVMDQYSVL